MCYECGHCFSEGMYCVMNVVTASQKEFSAL
jgi:hypothetical protein